MADTQTLSCRRRVKRNANIYGDYILYGAACYGGFVFCPRELRRERLICQLEWRVNHSNGAPLFFGAAARRFGRVRTASAVLVASQRRRFDIEDIDNNRHEGDKHEFLLRHYKLDT